MSGSYFFLRSESLYVAACFSLLFVSCTAPRYGGDSPTQLAGQRAGAAMYHGCPVFTAGDWYNKAVSRAAIDGQSKEMIASMASSASHIGNGNAGAYADLPPHQDFEINLATGSTPTYHPVSSSWRDAAIMYPHPVPWQSDFFIQGGNVYPTASDQHGIVLDTRTCRETEMYETSFDGHTLHTYAGWQYDLTKPMPILNGPLRGYGDNASGLPIIAGTFKDEELAVGAIPHALNIVPPICSLAATAYVLPSNGNSEAAWCIKQNIAMPDNSTGVPYGAHLRLRANFVLACSCPQTHTVVQALKTYGAYISDTGSPGVPLQIEYAARPKGYGPNVADRLDLSNLSEIHISDFDVLRLERIYYQP